MKRHNRSARARLSLVGAALLTAASGAAFAIVTTPDVGGFFPDPDWGGSWYRATVPSPANTADSIDYSVNAETLSTDTAYCHHYARKSEYGAYHHIFVPRWLTQPERHSAVDAAGTLGDAVSGPAAKREMRCWWYRPSPVPTHMLIEYRTNFSDYNPNSY